MAAHGVRTLIYSSTCATYGEPEKMPITEETPQVKILTFIYACVAYNVCFSYLHRTKNTEMACYNFI